MQLDRVVGGQHADGSADGREFARGDLAPRRRIRVVQVQPRPEHTVLELAFQDLESELQEAAVAALVGFISDAVMTATYLPAGIGSKSRHGSTWFASNPVQISHVSRFLGVDR